MLITLSVISLLQAGVRWSSSFNINVEYDNNIFYLSPADLQKFRLSEIPARFPYYSADDIDWKITAGLRGSYSANTIFGLRFRLHQYIINQEKSYGLVNARIQQQAGNIVKFVISYTWLPNYLIRYYPDPEIKGSYFPCRFGEHLFGIDLQRRFGTFRITPGYRFEIEDYLKKFDYYDTKAHRFSTEFQWRPVKNMNLHFDYQFKIARAKGMVPDISYDQHQFEITLGTRPRAFSRFGIEVGYQFCHREYTTDNPITIDLYHYGRIDETQTITANSDYQLKFCTLILKYQLEWREVTSPYNEEIDEIKDYRVNRISFGINLPLMLESKRTKQMKGENW